MKKIIYFILILVIGSGSTFVTKGQSTQSGCKVLLDSISGSYTGDCKGGLAHGNGIARGVDEYNGKFKEGLPDGKGRYIWANGNYYDGSWSKGKRDGKGKFFNFSEGKTITAIWKDDGIEKDLTKYYKILRASNVRLVSAQKNIKLVPGTVEIIFKVPQGHEYYNSLQLSGSSGYVIRSQGSVAFKDVTYPFKGEISFVISGDSFVIHKNCIVEFELLEEGAWTVTITE